MALVATDAVVLHAQLYSESSRILRLATRAHGVVSVMAKGARKTQRRFGSAVDLFAEGEASYYAKSGRDLQTLAAFEVSRARVALGHDLDRFTTAAVVAELVLRFGRDEPEPAWYAALVAALDAIETVPAEVAREAGLAGAWAVIGAMGFTPSLDACARCGRELDADAPVRFSQPLGGALCDACAQLGGATRTLPADARATLRVWLGVDPHAPALQLTAGEIVPMEVGTVRAHQRLMREFLREHLTDGRPLRAFETWEGAALGAGSHGSRS
ncbi:MAG TPA: DNA repair protein RecO [Gemmatirosa sp.]